MSICLRRRDFIAGLGGAAAAWPLLVWAQPGERLRRVTVTMGLAENDPDAQARLTALTRGLRDLGWTEGRQGLSEAGFIEGPNVAIEFRWAEGETERLPELASAPVWKREDASRQVPPACLRCYPKDRDSCSEAKEPA
jgi:putative ABC transport system substrate-binding protein